MTRFSQALLAPIAAVVLVAAAPAETGRVRLQLDAMPVSELVTILYRDVLRIPYIVAPDVATDRRAVSIRLDAPASQVRAQIVAYLRAMGLVVTNTAGVDQITTRSSMAVGVGSMGYVPAPIGPNVPSGSPLSPAGSMPIAAPIAAKVEQGYAIYAPRYRDPAYIADLLRSLFPDLRFGTRPAVQAQGDSIEPQTTPDVLVFAGPREDIDHAQQLLAQLDVQQTELSIKATVYEVQTGETNSSALRIAFNVLGKLAGGLLTATSPADTFLRLTTKNVDVAVSALNNDSRFRVVTSPSVRTRSGAQAVLTSGQQVPVLGAVSYQGDSSTPVQSVEYRDSGVILKVRPVVHSEVIDLDISQELSNFVATDTGVNATPTLIKRALTNSLSLRSGDVVVLGGLTEDRQTAAKSGFLGLGSRSKTKARTEILLVLQVDALGGLAGAPAAKRGRTAETPQGSSSL